MHGNEISFNGAVVDIFITVKNGTTNVKRILTGNIITVWKLNKMELKLYLIIIIKNCYNDIIIKCFTFYECIPLRGLDHGIKEQNVVADLCKHNFQANSWNCVI